MALPFVQTSDIPRDGGTKVLGRIRERCSSLHTSTKCCRIAVFQPWFLDGDPLRLAQPIWYFSYWKMMVGDGSASSGLSRSELFSLNC